MNDFFSIIIVMLGFVNLFGMIYASVEIELAYNINSGFLDFVLCVSAMIVLLTTFALASICQSFNMIYLGLILPVSILVGNISVVRLAKNKVYKRNVKPYLQIKI